MGVAHRKNVTLKLKVWVESLRWRRASQQLGETHRARLPMVLCFPIHSDLHYPLQLTLSHKVFQMPFFFFSFILSPLFWTDGTEGLLPFPLIHPVLGSPCFSQLFSCHRRCSWQLTSQSCGRKHFSSPETDLVRGSLTTNPLLTPHPGVPARSCRGHRGGQTDRRSPCDTTGGKHSPAWQPRLDNKWKISQRGKVFPSAERVCSHLASWS